MIVSDSNDFSIEYSTRHFIRCKYPKVQISKYCRSFIPNGGIFVSKESYVLENSVDLGEMPCFILSLYIVSLLVYGVFSHNNNKGDNGTFMRGSRKFCLPLAGSAHDTCICQTIL